MKNSLKLTSIFVLSGFASVASADMSSMPPSIYQPQTSVYVNHQGHLVLGQTVMPGNSDEDRDATKSAATIKSVNGVDELYMVSTVEGRRDQSSMTLIRKVVSQVMGPDGKPIGWVVKSDAGLELVDSKDAGAKTNVTVGSRKLIDYLKNNTTGKLDVSRRTLFEAPHGDQGFIKQIKEVATGRHDFARTNLKDWYGDDLAPGQAKEKALAAKQTKGANGPGEVNAAERRANLSFQEARSLEGVSSVTKAAEKATSEAIREER